MSFRYAICNETFGDWPLDAPAGLRPNVVIQDWKLLPLPCVTEPKNLMPRPVAPFAALLSLQDLSASGSTGCWQKQRDSM